MHADEARSNKKRLAARKLSETKMWHGGASWENNDDDDVEFQDTTTQKRKSHEIIEIPDSSDENASASEDEDVRQAEVKPSPAKKPKRKVSLPKCAATKAPTNLPPRVDCVAPPNLTLPRAGVFLFVRLPRVRELHLATGPWCLDAV